eukprot:TRINITY_DN5206_c0_g4_i1.p1 TRINITY_DN5206_c0_g4~~TRINITY_DN5206_c0_g4_i1.p1  ORF type:complete len:374 (-),score=97.03 TRINITY_DN5206_c0_g4_i1:161-1282(-)
MFGSLFGAKLAPAARKPPPSNGKVPAKAQAQAGPAPSTKHFKKAKAEVSRKSAEPEHGGGQSKAAKRRRKLREEREAEEKKKEAPVAVKASEPPAKINERPGKKRKKKAQEEEKSKKNSAQMEESVPGPSLLLNSTAKETKGVVAKAAERLKGSRFRWLNEQLYTKPGHESFEIFQKDPSLATAYHEGFRSQAAKWPRNPLDGIISWLKKEVEPKAVIGDFGCGEARLALELKGRKVHSLDLVKVNDRVTPCNLANVPLKDGSLNIAVFCLALMGTDWPKFVAEAWRCLRPGGLLHIAEVESRFADVDALVEKIESIGFEQVEMIPGTFFVEMRFSKVAAAGGSSSSKKKKKRRTGLAGDGDGLLTACTYRKR